MSFKSGFVSIVGNPNVGKSTLFNKLLNEDLSVVTNKPQTSRNKLLGIINHKNYQLILIDTPGYVNPSYKLHEYMNSKVFSSFEGSDLIIYVSDITEKKINDKILSYVNKKKIPLYFIMNKSDLIKNNKSINLKEFESYNYQIMDIISCDSDKDIVRVKNNLINFLPKHKPYYPKDYFTSSTKREISSETIRKNIFLNYKQEIPFSSFVQVYSFKKSKEIIKIFAYIFVETESQKKIIIGKKGLSIKKLGISSREQLESFFNIKVFLDLTVKVKKWRSSIDFLKNNLIS
tara:strand:+ start:96 stop:962 length:867 start_codon:yes stop_codon:yes gene_type:complete